MKKKQKLFKTGVEGELQKKQLEGMATYLIKKAKNRLPKKKKKDKVPWKEFNRRKKILKRFNEQLALPDDMFK